jgi:uncharacterized membrane protein
MKRLWVIIILFLAFCGLADSAYITQNEVAGTPLICNVNGLSGCNVVAASPYSHLLGIPLSEYGLLFYGALFVLAALELALYDRVLRRTIQWVAAFGFVMSIIFSLVQIAIINAVCIYCMASALVALLIFLFAWYIEPVRRVPRDHRLPPAHPRPFTMPPSA